MDCDLDNDETSANSSRKKQKKSHKKRRHAHDVVDGDETGKKHKKLKRKKQDSINEPRDATEITPFVPTQGTGFDNQSSLMLPLSINNTMVLNNPFGSVADNASQLGSINNSLNMINPLSGISNPLNLINNQLNITGHNTISNQLSLTNQVPMIHASTVSMATSVIMQNPLSSAIPSFLETSSVNSMAHMQPVPDSSAYSMSSFIPPSELEDSGTKRKRKKERKAARREKRRQAEAAALDPTGQFIENPGILGSPVSFSLVAKPVFKKSNNILAQTAVVAALTQEVASSEPVTQRQYRKHGDDGNGDEGDDDSDTQDVQESDDETELIRMRNELQEKLAVLAEERESAVVRVAQEEATPISIEIPDVCSGGGSDDGEILSAGEDAVKETNDQLPVFDSSPKESTIVTILGSDVSANNARRSEASSPVDLTVVKTVTSTDIKENRMNNQPLMTETKSQTDLPAAETQEAETEEGECETDGEIDDSEEEKVQSDVDDQVDEFGRSVHLKSKLQTESESDVDFRRSRSPSPDIYNDLDNEIPIESNNQDLQTSQTIPTIVNVDIPHEISDAPIPGLAWGLEGQSQKTTSNATIPFLNEDTKKEPLPGTPPVAYKDLQIIDATDDTNVSADQQKILNEKITQELKAIAGKAYEDSEKESSDDEDDTLTERPMDMFAASDIEPDTWSDHEVSKPIETKPELSSSSDSDSDSDDSDLDSTATPVISTTKATGSLLCSSPPPITVLTTVSQVDNSLALSNAVITHLTTPQVTTSTTQPLENVTSKEVHLSGNVTPVENSELAHAIDSILTNRVVEKSLTHPLVTTDIAHQKSENPQTVEHIDTIKEVISLAQDDKKINNDSASSEVGTNELSDNRATMNEEKNEKQEKIVLDQDDATMRADDDDDSDLDERNKEQKEADEKEEEAAKQMMGDIEYEKTLEKLQSLRGKVDEMSVEELELALKDLPSMNEITEETLPADGRRTPPHLRDIEISVKPLVEYLTDKKLLYKQLFKCINKKEFKAMLPKPLQKYDVREVRNWCLDELEIMSKKRLRAIILQQYLASSSSEDEDDSEHEELINKANTKGKDDTVKQANEKNKPSDLKEPDTDASKKGNVDASIKDKNENAGCLDGTQDNHTRSDNGESGENMICDQVAESINNINNEYIDSIHNQKNAQTLLNPIQLDTSKIPGAEREGKKQTQCKSETSKKVSAENQDVNTTLSLNMDSRSSDLIKNDNNVSTKAVAVGGSKQMNNSLDEDTKDDGVNVIEQKQSFVGLDYQNDVNKNVIVKSNNIQEIEIENRGEASTDLQKPCVTEKYYDPDTSGRRRVVSEEDSPMDDEVNSLDDSNVDCGSENKNRKIKSNIKPNKVNSLDRSVDKKIEQKQTNKSNTTKDKDKKHLNSNVDVNSDASKSTISGSKLEKTSKKTKNVRSDSCSVKECNSDPKKPGLHSTEKSTSKGTAKKNNSKSPILHVKSDSKTVSRENKGVSSEDTDDSNRKKSIKNKNKAAQMDTDHSGGQLTKTRKSKKKSDSSSVEADSDVSGKVVSHTEQSGSDSESGNKSTKENASKSKSCVKQTGKSSIDANQTIAESKKKNSKKCSTTVKRAPIPKKEVKCTQSESNEENSNNDRISKKNNDQNKSVRSKKVPVKTSGDSHPKKKVPIHKKKEESDSDTDDSSSDSDDDEEEDTSSDEDTSSTDEESDSDSSSDTALTQKQETKNKGNTDKDPQKCSVKIKKEEASSDSSSSKLRRKKLQEERLGRREKRLEKQKSLSRAGHKNNKDSSGGEEDGEEEDGDDDDDDDDNNNKEEDNNDCEDVEEREEDEEEEDDVVDHPGHKNNKLGVKIEKVKDTKHSLAARLPPRHGGAGPDTKSHMMQATPGTRLLPFGNSCLPGMRPPHMVLTRKEGESENDYKSRVNWHQKQQQQMERQEGESESTYMKRLDGINSARAKNQEILADRYKKEIGMQVDKPVKERRRQTTKGEEKHQLQNEKKNDNARKRKSTEKQIYPKGVDKEERSLKDQKEGKAETIDVPLSQEEFYKMKEETKRQEKRQLKQMALTRKKSDRQEEEDDKGEGKSLKIKSTIKSEVDEKPSSDERLRMARFLKKEKMQKKEKINSDRNVDKGNENKKDNHDDRVKPAGYDERKRLRDLREREEKERDDDPIKARELSRQKIRTDLRNSRIKHEAEKRGERVQKQRERCEEDDKREMSSSSSVSDEEEASTLSTKVKSEPPDQDYKVNDANNDEINSHEEGAMGAKKSNLKELEFRARALKSLLVKKET